MLYNYVKQDFIDVNKFSRPGVLRESTTHIVMHYTANPGASDEGHQLYFDGLKKQSALDKAPDVYASAHIFVDKDSATEIVPLNEKAYHASAANAYSIGIEMCIEKDGSFHPDMLKRTVKIVAELCKMYTLDPEKAIIRHYDVTGKACPLLWVQKPELYKQFIFDVKEELNKVLLDKDVAEFVLSVLSNYWQRMDGNDDVQSYTHHAANKIREAANIPTE